MPIPAVILHTHGIKTTLMGKHCTMFGFRRIHTSNGFPG